VKQMQALPDDIEGEIASVAAAVEPLKMVSAEVADGRGTADESG